MYAEDVQSFMYWTLKQTLYEVYLAGRVVGRWPTMGGQFGCSTLLGRLERESPLLSRLHWLRTRSDGGRGLAAWSTGLDLSCAAPGSTLGPALIGRAAQSSTALVQF